MKWTAFARDTGRNRWYRCLSEFDGAMRPVGRSIYGFGTGKKADAPS